MKENTMNTNAESILSKLATHLGFEVIHTPKGVFLKQPIGICVREPTRYRYVTSHDSFSLLMEFVSLPRYVVQNSIGFVEKSNVFYCPTKTLEELKIKMDLAGA